MKLLFRHLPSNTCIEGHTYRELYDQLYYDHKIIDYKNSDRKLIIYNCPDTVSFSPEFNKEELQLELNKRALEVLIKYYQWELYETRRL